MAVSPYFRKRADYFSRSVKDINGYLKNEQNYAKLKCTLLTTKLKLVLCDVTDLPKNRELSDFRYDLINLSNIPNYLIRHSVLKDPICYYLKILDKTKLLLKRDGAIMTYSLSLSDYPNEIAGKPSSAAMPETTKHIINSGLFDVKIKRVNGLRPGTRDKVTILIKK